MKHWACGYWYRGIREDEALTEWPRACWMPSLDFYGDKLFFVAAGNWHPAHIVFMEYDMNANTWELLHYENQGVTQDDATSVIRASDQVGQARFVSTWKVWWAYKADQTGPKFNEAWSGFGYGLWVLKNGEDAVYSEFLDAEKELTEDCAGKMDIDETGRIVIMYTLSASGDTVVKYSDDFGVTFSIVRTLANDAARLDYAILFDENGDIVICYQSSSTSIKYERSDDNGATWSSPVTQAVGSAIERITLTESSDYIWCVAKGTETRIYRVVKSTFADYLHKTVDAEATYFYARAQDDFVKTYQNDDGVEDFFHWGGTTDGWVEGTGDAYTHFPGAHYNEHKGVLAGNAYWYGYSHYVLKNHATNAFSFVASMNGLEWKWIDTPLVWQWANEEVYKVVDPVWPFDIQRNKPIAGWDWSKI